MGFLEAGIAAAIVTAVLQQLSAGDCKDGSDDDGEAPELFIDLADYEIVLGADECN